MSYKDFVLRSMPSALYLFDESASGSATDYSGYGRTATLSFTPPGGILPLVSGTTLGTKLDGTDYITYPAMPVWGNNQNSYEFSIEFWLYENGTTDQFTIFAPEDTDGPLIGSGIFYEDGKITFSIGNGTGLTDPDTTMIVTHQLTDRTIAHHIVCEYRKTGISISVDGGRYFESYGQLMTQFRWGHTLDKFATRANGEPFIIDCVAIYQYALDSKTIYEHYVAGLKNMSDTEVVRKNGGYLFPVNNEGSDVSVSYHQPKNGEWNVYYQDNLLKNKSGLALRPIAPAVLSSGTETYDSGSLALSGDQYLVVNSFSSGGGRNEGAVSGNFYFSNTDHNDSNEYCLFSIESGRDTLSVTQNTENKLVLRHTYYNFNTSAYVTIDTVAANIVYDAFSKVLLTWSYGVWWIYYNSESPVMYDSSSQKTFSTVSASKMVIGCYGGSSAFFNSKLNYINIWNKMPTYSVIDDIISSVGTYTLKLTDSLNVSQVGQAIFFIDLGGIYEVEETRLNYGPINSNVLVEYSVDNDSYSPCTNNDYIPGFTNGDDIGYLLASAYIRVTLSTDDSFFDITELRFLDLEMYSVVRITNDHSSFMILPVGEYHTGQDSRNILTKYDNNGISFNGGHATMSLVYGAEGTMDDGRPTPAELPVPVKTIEMFLKQNETSGTDTYLDWNTGEFSLNTATDVSFSGFDECYINGTVLGGSYLFDIGEWTHVILTTDGTSGANRINLFKNPRLEANDNGWVALSEVDVDRVTTISPPYGTYSYELTANTTSTSNFGVEFKDLNGTDNIACDEDLNYSASVFLRSASVSRAAQISIIFYDSMDAELQTFTSDSYNDFGCWSLFSISGAAPTGTASLSARVVYESDIPTSEIHYASNILIEQTDTLYSYFDGSFDNSVWSGTEDASSSSMNLGLLITENSPLYIANNSDLNENSVSSFTNIALYSKIFDLTMSQENYNSYIGRNIVAISSGDWNENGADDEIPMLLGGLEDYDKIIDLAPFAISTAWSVQTSA